MRIFARNFAGALVGTFALALGSAAYADLLSTGVVQSLNTEYSQKCKTVEEQTTPFCKQLHDRIENLSKTAASDAGKDASGTGGLNYAKDKDGGLPPCPASYTIDQKDQHGYQCKMAQAVSDYGNTAVQGSQLVGGAITQARGNAAQAKLLNDTSGTPKQSEIYHAAGDLEQQTGKTEQQFGAGTGLVAVYELAEAAKRSKNAKEITASINKATIGTDSQTGKACAMGSSATCAAGGPAAGTTPGASGAHTPGATGNHVAAANGPHAAPQGAGSNAPSASDQNLGKGANKAVTQDAVSNMAGSTSQQVVQMGDKAAEEQRALSKKLMGQGLLHLLTSGAQIARGLLDQNAGKQLNDAADKMAALENQSPDLGGASDAGLFPGASLDPLPTGNPIALPGFNPGADTNPNTNSNTPFGPSVPTAPADGNVASNTTGTGADGSLGAGTGVPGAGDAAAKTGPVTDQYAQPDAGAAAGNGGFGSGGVTTAAAKPNNENGDTERAVNAYQGSGVSAGGGRRGGGGGGDFGSELSDAFKALLAQQQKDAENGDRKSILDYGRKPASSEEESLLSADVNIFERISAAYREKQVHGGFGI